jgi:hypothetical protein
MEMGTRKMLLAAGMLAAGVMGSLSVSAWAGPMAPAATARADATAEQVMADSVKAMGGKEAIEKIKTIRIVTDVSMSSPQAEMKAEMESLWSRAGGRILRTKTEMGNVEMGTDGKVTWKNTPMGSGSLTPDEANALKAESSMIMNLLEPERFVKEEMTKVESAGTETFDGKECHRLHFTKKDGEEGDLFYDATTHLPIGLQRVQKQGGVEQRAKMVLGDWQEEQGVKIYRTINVESPQQPGMTVAMKVTKVEINTLEDSAFAPPAGAAKPATPPATAPGAGAGAGTGGGAGTEIKFEDLTPEQQRQAQQMIEKLKSGGDVAKMKQVVSQIEPTLSMINDAEKRKPIEYAIQEVKKEIARLGG